MSHLSERILFGAAYYAEYLPSPRLEEDMDLMQAGRFTVIRVGESVWSTWEPENGIFDLDWLAPVLDAAHARGISVIIGTPTYAAPPWLARAYPEINAQRATGQPAGWGARQEIDFTHPAFLFHAERIIRKIVNRYSGHPAVTGFQVDNEPGNEIFHNHGVFQKFVDHLRHTYGTVENLNTEWGLTYWSHRLSTWADLWTPDGNAQPQYALAWRRFQAQLTTDFIHWQASIVREYARADQFVTTCISYERKTAQDDALPKELDITGGNPYYRMQDYLALPANEPLKQEWTTEGTWSLYATADRMFSSKQAPFLVTETNAQAIGHSHQNEPAYDGQWRRGVPRSSHAHGRCRGRLQKDLLQEQTSSGRVRLITDFQGNTQGAENPNSGQLRPVPWPAPILLHIIQHHRFHRPVGIETGSLPHALFHVVQSDGAGTAARYLMTGLRRCKVAAT